MRPFRLSDSNWQALGIRPPQRNWAFFAAATNGAIVYMTWTDGQGYRLFGVIADQSLHREFLRHESLTNSLSHHHHQPYSDQHETACTRFWDPGRHRGAKGHSL
jgi:hypothetical protein